MGITVYRDRIVALLQHIASVAGHIVRSHIFRIKGDRDRLGCARLQHLCLLEIDQVGGCFLDPAVCVRRIVVDFHHIFACHVSRICNRHIKCDLAVFYSQITHLLRKCSVGQSIAEGILHGCVIIDLPIVVRCLIIFISYIDPFHVIRKRRVIRLRHTGVHTLYRHVFHIRIAGCLPVIPPRCRRHIVDKRIRCPSGWIHLSGQDLAQCLKAYVARSLAPECCFDLVVLFYKSKFHRVR